jgi:enamine deaminase RidA (YjgF/YER057c/UK114 family)
MVPESARWRQGRRGGLRPPMHACSRGGLKSARIIQEGVNKATILSLASAGLDVAPKPAILRLASFNLPRKEPHRAKGPRPRPDLSSFKQRRPGVEVPAGARLLFTNGQTGTRPDGTAPETAAEQTEVAFERLREVLNAARMDFADVVRFDVYFTDRADLQAFVAIRDRVMGAHGRNLYRRCRAGPVGIEDRDRGGGGEGRLIGRPGPACTCGSNGSTGCGAGGLTTRISGLPTWPHCSS